jgi:PTS system mannose-specific IIA component
MKVGLLIIAHDRLGAALMDTATGTLDRCPLHASVLSVSRDCDPEEIRGQARTLVRELDQGAGVLVLTDMYGSTPSNVACSLLDLPRVRVVAGINLPMLIRVFNYPELELDELTRRAVSGGSDGIVLCGAEGGALRA